MANDYTENMSDAAQLMTWKQLSSIDFNFDAPFTLPLHDNQLLHAEKVVRVLPKKRLVVFGTWMHKPVLAKLFFDPHHAKRHMEKDAAGVHILRFNKIPTPPIYYQGVSADKRIYVLLFERIFDAKSLEMIWEEKQSAQSLLSLLKHVMVELATQHVLGVLQLDLHLKNFLVTKKRLYVLDGGQIEKHSQLLPKKTSMSNLAVFLAQLGVGNTELQEKLFKHYAKARGWLLKPDDFKELSVLVKRCNAERWRHYEKKIFRESSQFACLHDSRSFIMYDRDEARPEFIAFLAKPEQVFNSPAAMVLKQNATKTEIKIKLDDKNYVIKRYSLNHWQRFFGMFKQSSARIAWRIAQKLRLFDVETAKPIAFIEHHFFGVPSVCFFVTEFISKVSVLEYLQHVKYDIEKTEAIVKSTVGLLNNLNNLGISINQLDIKDLLINKYAQPVFINVETAKEAPAINQASLFKQKIIKQLLEHFENTETKQKFIQIIENFD